MYSFGRDFDEGLKMDDIFREYIERKNSADFMDRASEALSGNGIGIQKKVFDAVSIKLAPFVQAAVNGIEGAGFLDIENVCNKQLIEASASDTCDAAFAFYGQFEEYADMIRSFCARRFLIECICRQMIITEFLYRINCL